MNVTDIARRREGDAPDSGVHHGTVTRVTDQGEWVEVPSVARGWEYGPCAIPTDWREWSHIAHDHDVTGETVSGGSGGSGDAAHAHGVDIVSQETAVVEHHPNLTAGTRVAVLLHPGGYLLLARY